MPPHVSLQPAVMSLHHIAQPKEDEHIVELQEISMREEQCKDNTPDDLQPQCPRKPQHQPCKEITRKQRSQEPHATNSLIPHEAHWATARHHPRCQQVKTYIRYRRHQQLQCLLLDKRSKRHRQRMMAEIPAHQHEQRHMKGIQHLASPRLLPY